MSRWLVSLGVLGLLTTACTTTPDPRAEVTLDPPNERSGSGSAALTVTVQRAIADGRYVHIDGRIENHFRDPVQGVRYTIRLISPGAPPRVLDTVYRESGISLDPGEDKVLRIRIENTIAASSSGLFAIEADPVRLGDQDVPPPRGWKE